MKYFQTAVIKLTMIYIGLLMGLSLVCSVWLYNVAGREAQMVWTGSHGHSSTVTVSDDEALAMQSSLLDASKQRLLKDLFFFNLMVLGGGTIASYALARRTLRPIQDNYQLQEEFASNASHELRTPLTALKAELQLARQDLHATPKKYRAAIDSSLEEVDRLIQLSGRLLQLSAPSQMSKRQTSKLLPVLQKTTKQFAQQVDKKHLTVSLPEQDVVVPMNLFDMAEVLTILMSNAVKFSPEKGRITFKTLKNQNKIEISVTDEGQGIEASEIPHIFERFYRSPHTSHQEGHGLGLSIAQKLVAETGGSLGVQSRPGHTTFTISLPI